jgi:hypothetical protein
VVGVIAVPYLGFGVPINIVFKENITYPVTIGDIPYCTCPKLNKNIISISRKEREMRVLQTSL